MIVELDRQRVTEKPSFSKWLDNYTLWLVVDLTEQAQNSVGDDSLSVILWVRGMQNEAVFRSLGLFLWLCQPQSLQEDASVSVLCVCM